MATVPTTNAFGEVSAYSSVPVDVPDYTRDIMAGMRQKQAQEDEAIREAARQKRIREEKLNKYKGNLGRWIQTQDKGIWKGRTEEVKALAEDTFKTMMKNRATNPTSYDPETDQELFSKELELQRAVDEFQQENKAMTGHLMIATDQKKSGAYNINEEARLAWNEGNREKFTKALSKNIYGDESRATEINTYSGVGFLNPIDTTDWHTQTVKAAKGLNIPIREVDLGNGKYRKTQQLNPEEKQTAYEAWATGAGAKMRQSMIAQAQANNPFFPEEKADEILKDVFIKNIEDNVNLKGGGGAGSYGEKQAEKLFFSPYTTKGEAGGAQGFNVGFIGGNKGLKSDLQYGNEVLKDVDLKTIYLDPQKGLKGIVMQYDYEQREMTPDEKQKEKQSAAAQMREPVLTKTVRSEKPKEIDFAVGSNNYNTIIEQYPGVQAKIEELMAGKQPAAKSKKTTGRTVAKSKIKSLVGTKGYEGYSEKELIDYYTSQGYTVK